VWQDEDTNNVKLTLTCFWGVPYETSWIPTQENPQKTLQIKAREAVY